MTNTHMKAMSNLARNQRNTNKRDWQRLKGY